MLGQRPVLLCPATHLTLLQGWLLACLLISTLVPASQGQLFRQAALTSCALLRCLVWWFLQGMKNPLDGVMQLVPQKATGSHPGQKAPTGMFQYFLKVRQQQVLSETAAGGPACDGSLLHTVVSCKLDSWCCCTTALTCMWWGGEETLVHTCLSTELAHILTCCSQFVWRPLFESMPTVASWQLELTFVNSCWFSCACNPWHNQAHLAQL